MSKWYLFVKQSIVTGEYYIHNKSKYHYFKNNESLCGGKWMLIEEFETNNITDDDVFKDNTVVCKKCYKKWMQLKQ